MIKNESLHTKHPLVVPTPEEFNQIAIEVNSLYSGEEKRAFRRQMEAAHPALTAIFAFLALTMLNEPNPEDSVGAMYFTGYLNGLVTARHEVKGESGAGETDGSGI